MVRIHSDWCLGLNQIKSNWFLAIFHQTRYKTFFRLIGNDSEWFGNRFRNGSEQFWFAWNEFQSDTFAWEIPDFESLISTSSFIPLAIGVRLCLGKWDFRTKKFTSTIVWSCIYVVYTVLTFTRTNTIPNSCQLKQHATN